MWNITNVFFYSFLGKQQKNLQKDGDYWLSQGQLQELSLPEFSSFYEFYLITEIVSSRWEKFWLHLTFTRDVWLPEKCQISPNWIIYILVIWEICDQLAITFAEC